MNARSPNMLARPSDPFHLRALMASLFLVVALADLNPQIRSLESEISFRSSI
jgi:hypothetical protein